MESGRLWCEVTKEQFREFLPKTKDTTVKVTESIWNGRKSKMCLVLANRSLALQTKIEIHPGMQYLKTTLQDMLTAVLKHKKPRGEFDKDNCKTCKRPILWITDPQTKKRQPLDAKPRRGYVKTADSKVSSILGGVYVNHNDTCHFLKRNGSASRK
jgi:hypothetical protein